MESSIYSLTDDRIPKRLCNMRRTLPEGAVHTQAGSIDVEIGGNRVATIDKKGTVFGEMALLLNEKRSATLRAKNNTV